MCFSFPGVHRIKDFKWVGLGICLNLSMCLVAFLCSGFICFYRNKRNERSYYRSNTKKCPKHSREALGLGLEPSEVNGKTPQHLSGLWSRVLRGSTKNPLQKPAECLMFPCKVPLSCIQMLLTRVFISCWEVQGQQFFQVLKSCTYRWNRNSLLCSSNCGLWSCECISKVPQFLL